MEISKVLDLLNGREKPESYITDMLKKWKDVYYGMSLHTIGITPSYTTGGATVGHPCHCSEYQFLFDRKLLNRHERESTALRNLRYSLYKPLTKSPFSQITEVVTGTIFQDSNYNIEIPNDEDKDFIWSNHFNGYDIIGYFSNIGYRNMVEDPNGLFLRIPDKPYYEQPDGRVNIDIWFVNSKDIIYYDRKELLFKKNNRWAYYIDESTIWRFERIKEIWILKETQGYYAHMLGKLPVTVAGGEYNTHGYYDSFYDKAKAIADDFIASYSAAQLIDKEMAHPYIVSASEDCPDCQSTGTLQWCNGCNYSAENCICDSKEYTDYAKITCNKCGGSGQQSRNPGQWLILPYEQLKDGDPIKIISAPVANNMHLREVAKTLYEQMMHALHLRKTDKAESGVAKAIDQEWLYQFISKISNHLFDKIIFDTIADIIAYRNVTVQNGRMFPQQYEFIITKPTQFQIKTEEELLDDLSASIEKKIPVYERQKKDMEYAAKKYGGDLVFNKKAQVINALDFLNTMTNDEIMSIRLAGGCDQADIILHTCINMWLDDMIDDKGENWFIEAEISEIKPMVDAKKKEAKPTNNLIQQSKQAMIQQ